MKLVIGISILLLVFVIAFAIIYKPALNNTPSIKNNTSSGSDSHFYDIMGFYNASTITLTAEMPPVIDKIMIYNLSPEISGIDEAASMANKLGMEGEVKEKSGAYILNNDKYHLLIDCKSGGISYTDVSRWMKGNDKDTHSNLPSEDKAISIAKEFVLNKGLMPEDAVLRSVSHPGVVAINATGDVIGTGFADVYILFSREINGIPVVGPGSKLEVEIGGDGDVINLFKIWRECTPYKELSIITPNEAYEKLKKKGVYTSIKGETTANINKVYLAYFMRDATMEQAYILPVYVFEGDVKGENKSEKFMEYIPICPELNYELPNIHYESSPRAG